MHRIRKSWLASVALVSMMTAHGGAFTAPSSQANPTSRADDAAAAPVKLSPDWATRVRLDDLTDEISSSANRLAQNLKKPSDFDKFIKSVNAEAHLTAILAALVQAHPQAGSWHPIAAEIQDQALALAKAAETKGAKSFRSAQAAHKRILDLAKRGTKGAKAEQSGSDPAPIDWESLGELSHVMKRVDPAYKQIRGAMSSASDFKKVSEKIRHEAALLYTLGQIAPAYRRDEKEFQRLAAAMTAAALEGLEAAQSCDFDRAKAANTALNASCNDCHKLYRLDQVKDFNF
jgi:cytochrome c556